MTHPQLRVRCPVLMSHADSRFLAMFFPLSTLLVPSSHINFNRSPERGRNVPLLKMGLFRGNDNVMDSMDPIVLKGAPLFKLFSFFFSDTPTKARHYVFFLKGN